jgi:hypothetical protein
MTTSRILAWYQNPEKQLILAQFSNSPWTGARLALSSRPTAELVVNAAALVPIGSDRVQTAQLRNAFSEPNVRTPTRHICGDCHRTKLASAGDDFRFLFLVARIQDLVRNISEGRAKPLGFLDTDRSYQDRLARRICAANLPLHSPFLLLFGLKQDIETIDTDHWSVRGNHFYFQSINAAVFLSLRRGCPRHAANLGIECNQILQSDVSENSSLLLGSDPFLRFDGRM